MHTLKEWVDREAADAILSHPIPHAPELQVGGTAACTVSPHSAWLREVWARQRNCYFSSSERTVFGDEI